MAKYTGRQSVLDAALGEYKDSGFSLVEPDDHIILLYHNNKRVAAYNQQAATIELLRAGCQTHLDNLAKQSGVRRHG